MRPSLALLLCASLGGCTPKAYLLDHKTSSKTAMITADLARYGLADAQARCVGERLGAGLSIWQLRQFAAAGPALEAASPGPLTARDLLRLATQSRDPKVTLIIAQATGACGVTADPAPVLVALEQPVAGSPDPAITVPTAPVSNTPTTTQSASPQADAADQNGPKDYQPSDELVSALTAYDKADFAAAARFAKAAADKGDSGAQQFLGGLYSFGRGVPQDHAHAVRLYRLAALQGWSEAMNNLGRAYETGTGVTRDPIEAMKWYLLASSRTTEDNEMVKRNIQNLVVGLSIQQVEKAARLADEWNQGRGR